MKTSINIDNPYWGEVESLFISVQQWSQTWSLRDMYARKYAWAIPDPASLAFVAEYLGAKAIEIGAGTGYWAAMLAQLGVDILAYDVAPPDRMVNHYFKPSHGDFAVTWYGVAVGGTEVLADHGDGALFLCWPSYKEDMASRCLQNYQGKRLVFIGEDKGGYTGDDAFFEELGKHWSEVADHRIMQWIGIHDHITVHDRKEELP